MDENGLVGQLLRMILVRCCSDHIWSNTHYVFGDQNTYTCIII